jgi:hypothetical protein
MTTDISCFHNIPDEVIQAARLVGNYFAEQGISKWELMDICSRNHADQNRAYASFFEFKREHLDVSS